jgi:hypothetical protein
MRRWLTWTVLGAALAASPVAADSALDRAYGTPELGQSVRSRAMGGAGSALSQGAYSLVDNPAGMAITRGSRLDLAVGLSRVSEVRFVPLFDTFDSFVDDAAIAVNDHQYADLSGGVVWDLGVANGLALGFGLFDRYDPRYDYYDERRSTSTSDQLLAERFITTGGVIRAASLGAAIPIRPGSALGLAFNWYQGEIDSRDALVPHASTSSGSATQLERRLSGFSMTAGASARVDERLQVSLAIETRPMLDNDYTQLQDGVVVSPTPSSTDLELPLRVQGAAAFRPRNSHRTTFALDVIWMNWSRVEDPLQPGLDLDDTWDARFGLEHVYYNALPGRIGFRYSRSYAQREADRAGLTLGIGYRVQNLSIDFSGEVTKRTSWQEPVWPREEQGPAVGAGNDRVEDTSARITLGIQADF